MANLSNGFQLMLIGMVTVFIILTIVIYGSKLLIGIINRFSSAEPAAHEKGSSNGLDRSILDAAVAQITGGTGHIVKITEL